MGKLIIDRENTFIGCAAKYNIFLDNVLIDSINNGNVREYSIPDGKHSIYLENGLISFGLKSNVIDFYIKENDNIRILCKSGFGSFSGISLEIDKIISVVNPTKINYDDLEKLFKLKEIGAINEEEFEREKTKILGGKL